MKVSELIAHLQTFSGDLEVVYKIYSEYSVLEAWEIETKTLCLPRPDGWVHSSRPDKPRKPYLVFPGN